MLGLKIYPSPNFSAKALFIDGMKKFSLEKFLYFVRMNKLIYKNMKERQNRMVVTVGVSDYDDKRF